MYVAGHGTHTFQSAAPLPRSAGGLSPQGSLPAHSYRNRRVGARALALLAGDVPVIWEVYGHAPRETVAVFFDWGDAASFAMRPQDFGAERRNLYVGSGRPRPGGDWTVTVSVDADGRGRLAA